ncbi:MAG: phosphoribosyltransferase family protein [Bacteroidota bacterium]
MAGTKTKILDQVAITARLKRMAFELYEANYQENELLVIGIDERGGYLAEKLCAYLSAISPLHIRFIQASLDRSQGSPEIGIELSEELEHLRDKPIVVVDDVLYTGSTLLNVVSILLQATPKSIQTAVLIDRGHRKMPVSSDFVGLEMATTLSQHISVEIVPEKETAEAYLM